MNGRTARALRRATRCHRAGFANTRRWVNRPQYRAAKRNYTQGSR